ncbi:MAG: hypothetical protein DRR42_19810 [Gammaproteobacteria bacterium]|nr:MAG: hypothetical protein DRR42_19810 [Gammaproteobacteria bacterium]
MNKFLWLLLLVPLCGHAEIYKHMVNGKVVFSDKPAVTNKEPYQVKNNASFVGKNKSGHNAKSGPGSVLEGDARDSVFIPSTKETQQLIYDIRTAVKMSTQDIKVNIAEDYATGERPDPGNTKVLKPIPDHPAVEGIRYHVGTGVVAVSLVDSIASRVGGNKIRLAPEFYSWGIQWKCNTNIDPQYTVWCKH